MKKLKIEITKTYCIDILCDNETTQEQAIEQAENILDRKMLGGTDHYVQTGDTEFQVYDVTNTEDPFDPDVMYPDNYLSINKE